MSYLAKRVLELSFLRSQNRIHDGYGYNARMLHQFAGRLIAGDY